MEKRHFGKWSQDTLADYCRSLKRETPTGKYKKQKKAK
jgi:hypothetical protein